MSLFRLLSSLAAGAIFALTLASTSHSLASPRPQDGRETPKPPPPQKGRPLPEGAIRCLGIRSDDRQTISSIAFSCDDKWAAVAYDTEIWLLNLKTGRRLPYTLQVNLADSMAFSADGKQFVVTSSVEGVGITAYDVATGKRFRTFPPPKYPSLRSPGQTAVSPDGKRLACSLGGKVRFFDLATGKLLPQPPAQGDKPSWVTCICYSHDGKVVVGGTGAEPSREASVHIWDAATSRLLRTFRSSKDSRVRWCALTPDGRLLAYAAEERRPLPMEDGVPRISPTPRTRPVRHVRLFEVSTGKEVFHREYAKHRFPDSWVALSPDGRYLVAPDGFFGLDLWDTLAGDKRHTFRAAGSIPLGTLLADGKTLVTSNQEDHCALYFWDIGAKMKPLAKGVILNSSQLEKLWAELGLNDGAAARRALWRLVGSPAQGVPFLRQRLVPAPTPDDKLIGRLIAELDSGRPAARRRARLQLERLSWHAADAIKQALRKPASLEQARALKELLKGLEWPYTSPDRLQRLRAIEALERIGTAEARKLLEELAKGAPQAPETVDAQASLQRLKAEQGRKR